MGKDLETNFDCREWRRKWEGKDSWLLKKSDEIEYFRPKSPTDTSGNVRIFTKEDEIDATIRRLEDQGPAIVEAGRQLEARYPPVGAVNGDADDEGWDVDGVGAFAPPFPAGRGLNPLSPNFVPGVADHSIAEGGGPRESVSDDFEDHSCIAASPSAASSPAHAR